MNQTSNTCHLSSDGIWDLGSPAGSFSCYNCLKTSQPPAWHCCCRVCTHLRRGISDPSKDATCFSDLRISRRASSRDPSNKMPYATTFSFTVVFKKAIALLELCQRSAVSFLRRAWARITISKLSKSFAQRGNELSTTSPFALGVGPEQNSLNLMQLRRTCDYTNMWPGNCSWNIGGSLFGNKPEELLSIDTIRNV